MIRVTILHASREGKRFDFDYYLNSHVPAVKQRLGAALQRLEVDRGLAGGAPGSAPPYLLMLHLFFTSVGEFQAAMAQHMTWIAEDRENYTDEPPVIQVSQALL